MRVSKSFEFDAAHRLHILGPEEKCHNIHGHRYKLTLEIDAQVSFPKGMVVDFNDLSKIKAKIDEEFDHSLLIAEKDTQLLEVAQSLDTKNKVMPIVATTTEEMASFFCGWVEKILKENHRSWFGNLGYVNYRVKLQESESTMALTRWITSYFMEA